MYKWIYQRSRGHRGHGVVGMQEGCVKNMQLAANWAPLPQKWPPSTRFVLTDRND